MIYVDPINTRESVRPGARHLGNSWCHLFTEPGNEKELHLFAVKLRLKRAWFQGKNGVPHYDLVPAKRKLALVLGAEERAMKDFIKQRRKK